MLDLVLWVMEKAGVGVTEAVGLIYLTIFLIVAGLFGLACRAAQL